MAPSPKISIELFKKLPLKEQADLYEKLPPEQASKLFQSLEHEPQGSLGAELGVRNLNRNVLKDD